MAYIWLQRAQAKGSVGAYAHACAYACSNAYAYAYACADAYAYAYACADAYAYAYAYAYAREGLVVQRSCT